MKRVDVLTGTDISICTPSHPFSVVAEIKRTVDRIVESKDDKFQYNCNSKDGIEMFELYGRKVKGLNVQYFINGQPSSYDQVLEDFGRAEKAIMEIVSPNANKDEKGNRNI